MLDLSVLPDKFHVMAIRDFAAREVYCDEKSEEKDTKKVKRKYKLTAKTFPDLNVYIFAVSTSVPTATSTYTSIVVHEHEWENKHADYLKGSSYFDAKKLQIHSTDEILRKRKDSNNVFMRVAHLPEVKYHDLQSCINKARTITAIPQQTKELLDAAYIDAEVAENALRHLGLL